LVKKFNRLNDPTNIIEQVIREIIDNGEYPVIQYCEPVYNSQLLKQVDDLCLKYGAKLEVRFYGHYSGAFDAAWLSYIPNVVNLSIDCLSEIENIEHLYQLENVEILSFGVFEFSDKDFLRQLQLAGLQGLSISDNRKKNIDLKPLENAASLKELSLVGHTKNIESIKSISSLKQLKLSQINRRVSLEFLNETLALEELEILLGGRDDIDELSITTLKILRILRVRGLEKLPSFAKFPNLECLHIEDQTKLESIDLSEASLKSLIIGNCKNLTKILNLTSQKEIFRLSVSRTKLDLDVFKHNNWPSSLKVISLWSGSNKWNDSTKQFFQDKGYVTYPWQLET
jgi:hypothetical protein